MGSHRTPQTSAKTCEVGAGGVEANQGVEGEEGGEQEEAQQTWRRAEYFRERSSHCRREGVKSTCCLHPTYFGCDNKYVRNYTDLVEFLVAKNGESVVSPQYNQL